MPSCGSVVRLPACRVVSLLLLCCAAAPTLHPLPRRHHHLLPARSLLLQPSYLYCFRARSPAVN